MLNFIKKSFFGFWQSVGFLTIIPLPKIFFSKKYSQMAVNALPPIGMIFGGGLAGLLLLFHEFGFFSILSALLVLVFGLVLTGGLHEDGCADFCDAYPLRKKSSGILSIMKDSRLGSFGAMSLMIVLYARLVAYVLLTHWAGWLLVVILAFVLGLSRFSIVLAMMLPLPIKIASSIKRLTKPNILSVMWGLQIFWLLLPLYYFVTFGQVELWWMLVVAMKMLALLSFLLLFFYWLHFRKKLPLTGDSLGFLAVITEIVFLFFFLSLLGLEG